MALGNATVDGSAGVSSRAFASFETNRLFAPDVLDIEDLWQWESLASGVSKTKPFALEASTRSSPETARLVVYLQGGSDAVSVVDHHVQVLAERGPRGREDLRRRRALTASRPTSPSRSSRATNELTVTNVGDTGVSSRVFLDRFELLYPQIGAARAGAFDGVFSSAGTAEVAGIASPAALLDVTAGGSWLTGYEAGPSLRFRAETGAPLPRRLTQEPSSRPASSSPTRSPPALHPEPGRLRPRRSPGLPRRRPAPPRAPAGPGPHHPRRLPRGDRLLLRRRAALRTGHPRLPLLRLPLLATSLAPLRPPPRRRQPRPQALQPQPPSRLPCPRSSGQDLLHLDRLRPRSRRRQRRRPPPRPRHRTAPRHHAGAGPRPSSPRSSTGRPQGHNLDGNAALVADDPDLAGDFEADARDIESSFLAGRDTDPGLPRTARPTETSPAPSILDAFNEGLSLHLLRRTRRRRRLGLGENILNSSDPASLLAQPRQPFMLTMNCLNGYFVAPFYESLAEGFLKAQGKGTIASFSPSGLSLDGPAHLYHRAVMQEITTGQPPEARRRHPRRPEDLRRPGHPRAPRRLPPLRRPRHEDAASSDGAAPRGGSDREGRRSGGARERAANRRRAEQPRSEQARSSQCRSPGTPGPERPGSCRACRRPGSCSPSMQVAAASAGRGRDDRRDGRQQQGRAEARAAQGAPPREPSRQARGETRGREAARTRAGRGPFEPRPAAPRDRTRRRGARPGRRGSGCRPRPGRPMPRCG